MKKLISGLFLVVVFLNGATTAHATKATAYTCTKLLDAVDPNKKLRVTPKGYYYYSHGAFFRLVRKDIASADVARYFDTMFHVLRLTDDPRLDKGKFCVNEKKFLSELADEKIDFANDCKELLEAACLAGPLYFKVPPKEVPRQPDETPTKIGIILDEIFDTEENYFERINALKLGFDLILRAIAEFKDADLLKKAFKDAFQNLEVITTNTETLLNKIKSAKGASEDTQLEAMKSYVSYLAQTEIFYREYRRAADRINNSLGSLGENEFAFEQHLNQILILPVQRLPRLVDLFNRTAANATSTKGQNTALQIADAAAQATSVMNEDFYLPHTKFNRDSGENVGGKTGSTKVLGVDKNWYQLKPSILENNWIRQVKVQGDGENFGEFIATEILRSMTKSDNGVELIPKVYLVYDSDREHVQIASRYIKNIISGPLDAYAQKNRGAQFSSGHARVTFGPSQEARDLSLVSDDDEVLRRDLARAIGVSALVGDHDINPGNMIVFDDNGTARIARIDLGHAFNDLLNAPETFGGRLRNLDNRILDFLNRETLANISQGQRVTKLWRDYSDISTSSELVAALAALSKAGGVAEGVESAKKSFQSLLTVLEREKKFAVVKHIKNSLVGIVEKMNEEEIDESQTSEEVLDQVFAEIEKFVVAGQAKMVDVAKLISLQRAVNQKVDSATLQGNMWLDRGTFQFLLTQYDNVKNLVGIKVAGQDKITWIKESASVPAFVGSLEDYMKNRFSVEK